MGAEEVHTENLIKQKARILFFQKGFLNATTQEIADEAGVNRALIHYYFRSRDQMLDIILDETLKEKKGFNQDNWPSDADSTFTRGNLRRQAALPNASR